MAGLSHSIVRSSSASEDTGEASGAGIYESIGDISSADALQDAITRCWKANFSLQAIAHRLRIHEYDVKPLPGLIIQEYIRAEVSGVVFSVDPLDGSERIFVEYTNGSSDGVESGTGETQTFVALPYKSRFIINQNGLKESLALKLAQTSALLKKKYQKEVEFEWAEDGKELFILQVRPITTHQKIKRDNGRKPVLKVFDLYEDSDSINQENRGAIKEIFEHSIEKRKPIRMFAHEKGIAINGAAVVIANHSGLDGIVAKMPISRLGLPIFSIDLGPHLRAFYAKENELSATLQTLVPDNSPTPFIIREFASGQFSAVSSMQHDQIIIEVCRGSLIGINRGFVDTETYVYEINTGNINRDSGDLTEIATCYGFNGTTYSFGFLELDPSNLPHLSLKAIEQIARFNIEVNANFADTILEWTIIDGIPVYIDNTPNTNIVELSKGDNGVKFISPGKIKGKVLKIDNLEKLEYISSGPTLNINGQLPTLESNEEIRELKELTANGKEIVIVSKFPYTALSVLVGQVQGFIFESGPILCHLAIIARENQVPVAIIEGALQKYENYEDVEI
ncbi:MAG TPA: PEP/pyruvate-binding domain-containing protein [Candidatus Saccharimonadales bacterium]|jgi:phosphohistidine swiveling domain-containing protein